MNIGKTPLFAQMMDFLPWKSFHRIVARYSGDYRVRTLPEAGAFYVMDRGYLDFERLHGPDQAGAFFVVRAKSNLDARGLYSAPIERSTGLICDQTIVLNGLYSSQHYPQHLRRIRFKDPGSGKTLVVLTHHFRLPALTVCALHRARGHYQDAAQSRCIGAYAVTNLFTDRLRKNSINPGCYIARVELAGAQFQEPAEPIRVLTGHY
jgi:Domain of unknown function (DUF4372)